MQVRTFNSGIISVYGLQVLLCMLCFFSGIAEHAGEGSDREALFLLGMLARALTDSSCCSFPSFTDAIACNVARYACFD